MKQSKICQICGAKMKLVEVKVEDAESKTKAYDCPKCGNLKFDKKSSGKIIEELKQK